MDGGAAAGEPEKSDTDTSTTDGNKREQRNTHTHISWLVTSSLDASIIHYIGCGYGLG